MSWNVIVTPEFASDLKNIYDYVAKTLLVPDTAKKIYNKIMESVKSLSVLPCRNPLYDKEPWKSRGLRKQVIDNFIVFYLPNENTKEVVLFHVLYGGRNIDEVIPNK